MILKNIIVLVIMHTLLYSHESDLDLHGTIDAKIKYMDIHNTKTDESKTYEEIEFKPYLGYYNSDYGIYFKTEVVFNKRNGEGTISPKSTSPFCPNFSYQSDETTSVYLKSLYVGKEFHIGEIEHEIGIGFPPFSDGWPNEYRSHNIPRGTGMAPLVQMSYESIYYRMNFVNLTSLDRAEFIISYGESLNLLPTNPDFNNKKYKGSSGLVAYLQLDDDKNKYKIMFQHDTLQFYNAASLAATEHKTWTLGETDILGFGYAYDNLDDNGNIFYNIFSVSHHTPDNDSMSELQVLINECAHRRVARGELTSGVLGELADTSDSFGWSNLIGVKQEIDSNTLDKTLYIGAEWFTTSKNWFTKAVDTPNNSSYNLYTKGNIYTLYGGIYFQPNMSLNLLYSRVENKWVNQLGSVNVGYSVNDTARDAYKTNNIFQIQYIWDF